MINLLVSRELDERTRAFTETKEAVDAVIRGWAHGKELVVPDTGFFTKVPNADPANGFDLREVDFTGLLDMPTSIHFVIPIAVVDELDGLKERGEAHVRWRAGHALGVFDEIFRIGASPIGQLSSAQRLGLNGRAAGLAPYQEVTAEIVLDPPGHTRLPIADDEIVDRALTIQAFADRPISLVTYDTSQATRAHQAGLKVVKLTTPIGDEPAPRAPRSGRRPQSGQAPAS